MDYYIDVKLKPNAKKRENVLLNEIYSMLHKALFTLNSTSIGVSFPRYHVMLGDVIRIHGVEEKLIKLQKSNWLGDLSGYCEVNQVQTIPEQVTYRTISRIQSNMTEAKLRRLINRGSISENDARKYKAKMYSLGMDNPYLELESSSNGHKHRRYLVFGELSETSRDGEFDSFGLSKTATIPWF